METRQSISCASASLAHGAVLTAKALDPRVPFKDGFLFGDISHLPSLRLVGSRCTECGIALFGVRRRCENCSSPKLRDEVFQPSGTVYTYTVQRYAPPKPHGLAEPWSPRPVAWVDLAAGGPRVLAPIDCAPEVMEFGMPVRLACHVGWVDVQGREVVAYAFEADGGRKELAA